jgi:hypothetical protein
MPYTSQFFSEKLNLPVEYFNPLRNIQIDPAVNLEELARVAHSLGEVVGLGLRNLAQCPIELNLMPKSIRQRQQLDQKKPYFIAAVLSVVLALLAMGWFYDTKVVAAKRDAYTQLQGKVAPLQQLWDQKLDPALRENERLKQEIDQITLWAAERTNWIGLVTVLRSSLVNTEAWMEDYFRALQIHNARAGLWIEKMVPELPGLGAAEQAASTETSMNPLDRYRGMSPEMLKRYGLLPQLEQALQQTPEAPKASTNEITIINLTCTAVNLRRFSPDANNRLATQLEKCLQAQTNYFDSTNTLLKPSFTPPETNDVTFNFELTLKLKQPIKI